MDNFLQTKIAQLRDLHNELEGWRLASFMDRAEERAEEFWKKSRHRLRSGFRLETMFYI